MKSKQRRQNEVYPGQFEPKSASIYDVSLANNNSRAPGARVLLVFGTYVLDFAQTVARYIPTSASTETFHIHADSYYNPSRDPAAREKERCTWWAVWGRRVRQTAFIVSQKLLFTRCFRAIEVVTSEYEGQITCEKHKISSESLPGAM